MDVFILEGKLHDLGTVLQSELRGLSWSRFLAARDLYLQAFGEMTCDDSGEDLSGREDIQ